MKAIFSSPYRQVIIALVLILTALDVRANDYPGVISYVLILLCIFIGIISIPGSLLGVASVFGMSVVAYRFFGFDLFTADTNNGIIYFLMISAFIGVEVNAVVASFIYKKWKNRAVSP